MLEVKEIGFGEVEFDYNNYGPFRAELAFAADDAESFGYIKTEPRYGFHSVPYTTFKSTDSSPAF